MTVSLESGSEQRQCFDIQTINDTIVEGTEVFSVFLTNPVGVTIVKDRETINIYDDGDSESVNIVLIVHVTCELKYIFSVVGIDFQSTTFTGTEGDSVSICFVITSGSVDLFGFVNVEFMTTDITATSMYFRNILS